MEKKIDMSVFTDPKKYEQACKAAVHATEPYRKAKKRLQESKTFQTLIAELSQQFPTRLVSIFEKEVLLNATLHEDWSIEETIDRVTLEFDKRLRAKGA